MRRHGLIDGRRGAALGASVAVLCLGGVLAACGGESGDDGYAAVGAAGSSPDRAPGRAVPPDGEVELVPLVPLDDRARDDGGGEHPAKGGGSPADGTGESTGEGASGAAIGDGSGSGGKAPDRGAAGGAGTPAAPGGSGSTPGRTGGGTGGGSGGGTPGGPTAPGSPGAGSPGTDPGSPPTTTPPPPPPPPAPAPAALKVGEPVRAAAGKRWCEKVTVRFRNTGGSPVRSGSVTFATHIIGALGVDWGTRYSTQPLPGPIAGGAAVNKTYTVCVDAWRVPLGMHVETQDVTADWK
ncbi:hypothetical protein ABCR94_04705 [Streptomyces sp. 21So2-11]|uniref:hypothetical protein n=1 Tax=Streptomyces sp. 21So2-11 TaxID=3144408 RepID=UPI0032197EED